MQVIARQDSSIDQQQREAVRAKAAQQHAQFIAQVKQLERQRVPFVSQIRRMNAHPSLNLDSLSADVKEVIERIGRDLSSLLIVRLTDARINDLSGVTLARALMKNSKLSQLVLSRNAIGDQGCAAITEALASHPNLLQLSLASNHIMNEGAQHCAELLRRNTRLMELNISAKPLNKARQSKFEQLLRFQITAAGALVIAQALRCNSTLTSLSLANQTIWDAGAIAIFKALAENNRALSSLDLTAVAITCASCGALGNCLRSNASLTRLVLAKNHIADEGAKVIADALRSNATLRQLDLGDNRITNSSVERFCEVLNGTGDGQGNTTLQYIATTGQHCTDLSVEELCRKRTSALSVTTIDKPKRQGKLPGLNPVRAFITPYTDSGAHLLYLKVPSKSRTDTTKFRPMVAIENAKIRNRKHVHLRRYDPAYQQLKQTQLVSQKYSQSANLPLKELWEHQARLNALSYAPVALRQIEQHNPQKQLTGKKLSVMRRYSYPMPKAVERRTLWQSQATTLQSVYSVHEC